jgi:TetR/AcrR family transcriptional regulator, regulator of biofilm formation and stress response
LTGRRPRGPADPGRRDRIVSAVLDLVAEHGMAGVSHRTVAGAAGVPLGSTTYYFDSLDDLLAGALERLVDDYAARLRAWAEPLAGAGRPALAAAVTDLVVDYLRDRRRARMEYALCVAAMDRPALRPAAARYTAVSVEVFGTLVPRALAVALTAAVDGFLVEALVAPEPLDRAAVQAAIGTILG